MEVNGLILQIKDVEKEYESDFLSLKTYRDKDFYMFS